ncbi:DNA-binding transcriptional regulator, CsgD family [Saccharicrinis carchari]|uniref:DNA-binding transcriptional regulator, CsgD family n=1 Tax=Saccharicrinis carchari TaxID=1168039 RepID=A0A521EKV1_SACCC|nr:triple tyrosine motif-containing protein [Saccharicrinis carchari]SMO83760.1 DNA-binding transcriptional regulator, CsgD family [Saccharicrinis carchari]
MVQNVRRCLLTKMLLAFLFIALTGEEAFSARIIPTVKSFEKTDYKAGRQNWDIAKDKDGIIYFANTDGLLCNIFGEWTLHQLEKGGNVRAIHAENDTVWVGGIEEFGYFFKRDNGALVYSKLGDLDGEIVWKVIAYENQIIYQTYLGLIIYDKATKKVKRNTYTEEFWTITEWEGELWAIATGGIIGVIRDNRFYHREAFTEQVAEVRQVFIHDKRLFIVTFNDVFVYDKNTLTKLKLDAKFKNVQFFTGCSLNKSTLLLGTVTSGLISIDYKTGDYTSISTAEGLLDNTVLSLKTVEDKGVWLGLDYGIAKVEFKKTIYPIFAKGATYHIKDIGNKTYLSTNKGAFISENDQAFQFIEGSAGQVWRIRAVNKVLYMCHNEGAYKIINRKLQPVFEETGVMDIARFGQSDYYLLSAYHGVLLVKYTQGKFQFISNLNVWGNPKLHYDAQADCIWGDTKKKPLVQFQLKNDKVNIRLHENMERFFETRAGLVFYNGMILMAYEPDANVFSKIQQAPFSHVAEKGIAALDIAENNGAVAYIANDEIKLFVTLPDGTVHSYEKFISSVKYDLIKADPFLNLYNNELRIATDRGVVVFNLEYQSSAIQEKPVITSVNIGSKGMHKKLFFPFKDSTINLMKGRYDLQLQFASPYSDYEFTEFRYKLEPYDKEWTEWKSKINKKEYTGISGGEYQFLLQTRVNQSIIKQTSLNINVSRHWFQNKWILIPGIITIFLIFAYVAFLIIRAIKEKAHLSKLAYEKRLKQEAVESKNEQLIQFLEIISHKNSFLQDIKTILAGMRNSEACRCVKKIDAELNNEKKKFLYHKLFSENSRELVIRVSKDYPALTDNDIRILTLIRTNMSSREIAAILNISNRSFDTSRYRIRKKLGLNHDEDLNSFIRNL